MAVVISSTSGNWSHGTAGVTISGSGFSAKATAAPALWNTMTGTMASDYNVTVPNDAASRPGYGTAYDMQYRSVGYRGVAGPHSRATKYLVAGHTDGNGPYNGSNAMATFLKASRANNDIFYMRWMARLDPNWQFGGSLADNNHKIWAFGYGGSGPYETPHEGYIDYDQSIFDDPTTNVGHKIGVDVLDDPDNNGHGAFWNAAVNPCVRWVMMETEFKIQTGTSGYLKCWSDNTLVVDYAGQTDDGFDTSMNLAIGGYSSTFPISPTNNFRYFADHYLDWTAHRIMIGDAATYAACTVLEPQIPSAWNDTGITLTVNMGRHADSGTAYLYVFDSTGAKNSSGFAITLGSGGGGGGGGPTSPNIPRAGMKIWTYSR